MLLDKSFRESLVDDLDDLLEAYGKNPAPESIAEFVLEQLEVYADENGLDDIVVDLEEAGELDVPLQEALETEMSSNDEFEFTGEEIVSLLERMCSIVWDNVDGDDDDDDELFDDED